MSLPTDLEARGEGKKLVMCIDDDPGVITLYKRYLEKQEYQVIGVTDPTKAVDEARRLLPYAITLDVMMPQQGRLGRAGRSQEDAGNQQHAHPGVQHRPR